VHRRWATFGLCLAAAAAQAPASSYVSDHNADGAHNVLDVAVERGLGSSAPMARGGDGVVLIQPAGATIAAGEQVRLLVTIDAPGAAFFGYSLDIDLAPLGPAVGVLEPNLEETNLADERNLILAAGAAIDPFFTLIQPAADGGLFLSTNTSDGSAVTPTMGVNDALAEIVLDASAMTRGEFRLEFGPATAFADANGLPVSMSLSSATIVVTPIDTGGTTHYETGDALASNDGFDDREPVTVADPGCAYISGKLQENSDPGRAPDTYLFLFDKDDNVLCEDDDSSALGNGKASACYGVAPVDNGDGTASVRLGVTGRPDGVDDAFDGLFFNAPHGQLGEARVRVTYRDDLGNQIDTDVYTCGFTTGAEAFRVNYTAPQGTASVDVEIDNTTESFPLCDDVDFYQLEGLDPGCDYAVTVVGGAHQLGGRPCAILGWFDKNGALLSVASDPTIDRNGEGGQGAQLSLISDANGRVRLAVSGVGDADFDGLVLPDRPARDVGTPGREPSPAHGCCACYTLKIERNTHPEQGTPECEDPQASQMALGDINLDNGIDILDLAIILNHWGWTAP